MTSMDADPGDEISAWLDDHVELYALDSLPSDEAARFERELAALPADERSAYEERITEVHVVMARYSSGYALRPPPELRRRVLAQVFDDPGDLTRPDTSGGSSVLSVARRRARSALAAILRKA
ncbi:hypothetical protein ABFT43_18035 [Gordonia sp. B21]